MISTHGTNKLAACLQAYALRSCWPLTVLPGMLSANRPTTQAGRQRTPAQPLRSRLLPPPASGGKRFSAHQTRGSTTTYTQQTPPSSLLSKADVTSRTRQATIATGAPTLTIERVTRIIQEDKLLDIAIGKKW